LPIQVHYDRTVKIRPTYRSSQNFGFNFGLNSARSYKQNKHWSKTFVLYVLVKDKVSHCVTQPIPVI